MNEGSSTPMQTATDSPAAGSSIDTAADVASTPDLPQSLPAAPGQEADETAPTEAGPSDRIAMSDGELAAAASTDAVSSEMAGDRREDGVAETDLPALVQLASAVPGPPAPALPPTGSVTVPAAAFPQPGGGASFRVPDPQLPLGLFWTTLGAEQPELPMDSRSVEGVSEPRFRSQSIEPLRDGNEAPTAIALSRGTLVGASGGAVVGTLVTTDADAGDSHSYAVDDGRFEIVDGNQLKLKEWAAIDPLVEAMVELSVTATDSGGLMRVEALTISVVEPSRETLVNTTTEGVQSTSMLVYPPSTPVASLAGGGWVVTWTSQVEGGSGIFGQVFAADGSHIGDEFRAGSREPSLVVGSNVAALTDGSFVLSWTSELDDDVSVMAQQFAADGSQLGEAWVVGPEFSGLSVFSSIAGLDDGGFVVTWLQASDLGYPNEEGYFALHGQRYDTAGNTAGAAFLIHETVSDPVVSNVVRLHDGGFVVIWNTFWPYVYLPNHTEGVHARLYDSSGEAQGDGFRIGGDGVALFPSVAALADGGFVVVWMSDPSEETGVFGQRYAADGMAVGQIFQVNDSMMGPAALPDVAALTDGGFVVSWMTNSNGNEADIAARRFDAEGEATGDAFFINETTAGPQLFPAVAGLPGGGFVVTWEGNGDGDDFGVFSRVFGGDGEVVVGTSDGDLLVGGAHDDTLYGMAGNDILDAGAGDNVLWGGPGADSFRISSLDGTSTIKDFSAEEGDVLALHGILTGLLALDGPSLASYLEVSAVDAGTVLRIDGSGGAAFTEPDAEIIVEGVDLVQGAPDQAALLASLVESGLLQASLDLSS